MKAWSNIYIVKPPDTKGNPPQLAEGYPLWTLIVNTLVGPTARPTSRFQNFGLLKPTWRWVLPSSLNSDEPKERGLYYDRYLNPNWTKPEVDKSKIKVMPKCTGYPAPIASDPYNILPQLDKARSA